MDGKLVASDEKIDLRMERMLALVPLFLSQDPKDVLVVGLGAGITAGTFTVDNRVKSLSICELEKALPPITKEFFSNANLNVLDDSRTTVFFDDAKHYLHTTRKSFDIISVDPIHPWVRGAAALYSEEFFMSCKNHMKPGAIVSFWVPLHSMSKAAVKSELASFFKVFEHGAVWHTGGTIKQRHMIVVGANEPLGIVLDDVDQLSSEHSPTLQSIVGMGFKSADEMLAHYAVGADDIGLWLKDAVINRDWSLRLEYLAGSSVYKNMREDIYEDLIQNRTWPKDLFSGDEHRISNIRKALYEADRLED